MTQLKALRPLASAISAGNRIRMRIPRKMGIDSTGSRALIPRHRGHGVFSGREGGLFAAVIDEHAQGIGAIHARRHFGQTRFVTKPRFMRSQELSEAIPYSANHIRRLEEEGKFPKRVQIGASRVGWVRAEVEAWIEARMGAR